MNWVSQLLSVAAKPFQWWVVVAPWEQALRIRRGKVAALLGPGIHFRIPFFDRVYRQSLRRRVITDTGQTVTTLDGKVVTVAIGVSYEVADLLRLYSALANVESVLLNEVMAAVTEYVAKTSSSMLTPDGVARGAELDGDLCANWGLKSVSVKTLNFAFVKTYRLLMNDYRSLSGLNTDDWEGRAK